MPNWREVLEEISKVAQQGSPLDIIRRKYLKKIQQHTERNVIAYYSGFLQRPRALDTEVNDKDISGFMLNIHRLDRSKGLDLILHTPGGDLTATESLVTYLKSMFGKDIRAIIPQISMSAGTIIALSCKEILMGKHSNLGPIDPQMGNMPCQAIIAEFDRAKEEIAYNPAYIGVWQFILSKYHPTLLSSCQNAIDMSEKLVEDWLMDNMCEGNAEATTKIKDYFSKHNDQKTHARHISVSQCQEIGVKVVPLEQDKKLQDLVLTAHHAFMHSFANSGALKIIENHNGLAYVENLPTPTPQQ